MSRSLVFAYPGNLALNTGGYAYDRRVICELGMLGWQVQPLSLGEGFPFPTDLVRAHAEQLLSELPDGGLVIVDGLAFGVLDDWAAREAGRLKIVALVHHPLALETGLDPDLKAKFHNSESQALKFAKHIVVTSPMTSRELVSNFGVDASRITVAVPGTDPAVPSTVTGNPPHIVSIGTLTPRKGHDVLLEALKRVEDLPWTATIIGSRTLDPKTAAALETQLQALDLGQRVVLAGECEDTRLLLGTADLFALASRYEGYGMVFAEALSQGLPIVACRAGAIPEVVHEDAGILVPVDDTKAFAEAIRSLLTDQGLRRDKAEGARRAGAELPGWAETAHIISKKLEVFS
ncbi:MAG: glycosyltransferase family 4 protein [Allorhizobium sp.]